MNFTLLRKRISPELFFIVSILSFGLLSTFITFPLSNGDEGFHLSRSYTIFSKTNPKSMQTESIRDIEKITTAPVRQPHEFDLNSFYKKKLADVEADPVKFNLQRDDNSTLKIDVAHLPAAIGVLLGKMIYPSYGVMLLFSRLSNLLFFTVCLFFIIKYSTVGKWSLIMLFSVPFLQKIASPSYDVFAYVAVAAFAVNMLRLAKLDSFKRITRNQMIYTLFTILLILFSKSNYLFFLLTFPILPMVTTPVFNLYAHLKRKSKVIFWIVFVTLILFFIQFLNVKFGLVNFTKLFLNNYLNVVTMERRGRTIFSVVSTILPDLFNLLWILATFLVMLSEEKYNWNLRFVCGEIMIFFINWLGIFAGFYLILGKPTQAFDDLSGRYLHPYIICFLPFTQFLSYRYNLKISTRAIQLLAISTTSLIMISYLLVCYYRGFIVQTTPTWIP